MKKLLLIPAALAAVMAFESPASAHTPTITAKCQTLTVDAKWYEDATITVTVDGTPTVKKFHGDWSGKFTGTKSWSVQIDDRGTKYDMQQSGEFVDCTPATTTTSMPIPTTSMPVPVETPFDVTVTQTAAFFGFDCATSSAWVQFVNDGTKADRVSVGGQVVDVPAGGFARVNLHNIGGYRFTMGPVTSLVNDASVAVQGAPEHDGTGAVSTVCLDTAVQTRQVIEQPTQLAFTGSGTTVKAGIGSALLAVGIFLYVMGARRKVA